MRAMKRPNQYCCGSVLKTCRESSAVIASPEIYNIHIHTYIHICNAHSVKPPTRLISSENEFRGSQSTFSTFSLFSRIFFSVCPDVRLFILGVSAIIGLADEHSIPLMLPCVLRRDSLAFLILCWLDCLPFVIGTTRFVLFVLRFPSVWLLGSCFSRGWDDCRGAARQGVGIGKVDWLLIVCIILLFCELKLPWCDEEFKLESRRVPGSFDEFSHNICLAIVDRLRKSRLELLFKETRDSEEGTFVLVQNLGRSWLPWAKENSFCATLETLLPFLLLLWAPNSCVLYVKLDAPRFLFGSLNSCAEPQISAMFDVQERVILRGTLGGTGVGIRDLGPVVGSQRGLGVTTVLEFSKCEIDVPKLGVLDGLLLFDGTGVTEGLVISSVSVSRRVRLNGLIDIFLRDPTSEAPSEALFGYKLLFPRGKRDGGRF